VVRLRCAWALALLAGCGGDGGDDDDGARDAAPAVDMMPTPDLDAGPDAAVLADAVVPADAAVADAAPPIATRVWVGVNDIPEDMLGAAPARWMDAPVTFAWTLPPDRWTIEVHVEAGPGWQPDDMPYLLWRFVSAAHAPVVIGAGDVSPEGGEWAAIEGGRVWRAQVVNAPSPDAGDYTLQAKVGDLLSTPLRLAVAPLTPEADPFDAVDRWVVVFSRDLGTVRVDYADRAFTVVTEGGPDGTPDFEEALAAVGLLGGDDAWREAILGRVRESMRGWMHRFFWLGPDGAIGDDSVRIRIAFEGDADAPAPDAEGWSRIAVGGDDPHPEEGRAFFGRAALDWNNTSVDDDTQPGRGIFTTSFLRFLMVNPITAILVAEYAPASGGHPFGSEPGDAALLTPDLDPATLPEAQRTRAARFKLLMDYVPLALASVTAHEIGHSLGLVKPGPPPYGLLGGVEGPWVVEPLDEDHIDTPGPNLMQSGRSFRLSEAFGEPPAFNAPNLAYLRRRLVVLPDPR
jgi:hypothetical protein